MVEDKRRSLRGGPDELKLTGSQVTYELKLVQPMGETQAVKKYTYVKFTSRNMKHKSSPKVEKYEIMHNYL